MGKEIEAQFIDINKADIIKRLKNIGAKQVGPEKLYRRYAFNLPNGSPNEFARVRDEGNKVTMTYKSFVANRVDGMIEIELVIDDFDKGCDFLKAIGLIEKAYQETKRLSFRFEDVEFDINTWPGLEPYLEIEAESKEDVKRYAELLGLDWGKAMFGGVSFIYAQKYKITTDWINNHCSTLKFSQLPEELTNKNKR